MLTTLNPKEFEEKYGLQGFHMRSAIQDMIDFYKENGWSWELKTMVDDQYRLILGLVWKQGITLYIFSKWENRYIGSISLSIDKIEEILEKIEKLWERDKECLESAF